MTIPKNKQQLTTKWQQQRCNNGNSPKKQIIINVVASINIHIPKKKHKNSKYYHLFMSSLRGSSSVGMKLMKLGSIILGEGPLGNDILIGARGLMGARVPSSTSTTLLK